MDNKLRKQKQQRKDNYFAFYGLPFKDELYFVTKQK